MAIVTRAHIRVAGRERRLQNIVSLADRGPSRMVAGTRVIDIHGQDLNFAQRDLIHRTDRGLEIGAPVKNLLHKLQTDEGYRLRIQAHFAGYDARSDETDPALWVLAALAYADALVASTGRKTGHIINLGRDCYNKHHAVVSVFAYTLLQTGILRNGGGLINWGIVDGGTMKETAIHERAKTGKNGHWFYATVSHRKEPEFRGGKFGMGGQVLVTDNLMQTIFERMVKGTFENLSTLSSHDPEGHVVTVEHESRWMRDAHVAEEIIRSRTDVSHDVPRNALLKGVQVAIDVANSPLMRSTLDLTRALGADVIVLNEGVKPYETNRIFDPNEPHSGEVQTLIRWAEGNRRTVIFQDPDGDRAGIIAPDDSGKPVHLNGSDILMLAAHNLATHNPAHHKVSVVGDMRAYIGLDLLGPALRANGYDTTTVPSEPGYSNVQEVMERVDAVAGGERTAHIFLRFLTHPILGAPEYFGHLQGGDYAGLVLVYMLALQTRMWNGRSAAQQLAYIRRSLGVPLTAGTELKPKLSEGFGMAKYAIAGAMKEIAHEEFDDLPDQFDIQKMQSGVRIYDKVERAAVLIRHSNSGSSFTVSSEYIVDDGGGADQRMLELGAVIIEMAIGRTRAAFRAERSPLADFIFEVHDLGPYMGRITLAAFKSAVVMHA